MQQLTKFRCLFFIYWLLSIEYKLQESKDLFYLLLYWTSILYVPAIFLGTRD